MFNISLPEPWQEAEWYYTSLERESKKRPLCDGCGENILDDDSYVTGAEVYCRECFLDIHRVSTESLIERF